MKETRDYYEKLHLEDEWMRSFLLKLPRFEDDDHVVTCPFDDLLWYSGFTPHPQAWWINLEKLQDAGYVTFQKMDSPMEWNDEIDFIILHGPWDNFGYTGNVFQQCEGRAGSWSCCAEAKEKGKVPAGTR